MKAIGYVRVSTDKQDLGPEAQRAALEAWAKANGADLVAVHEDLAVSGAAELAKRPGLLAALEDLERGAVLLVAKRDRLARDLVNAAITDRMVARKGAAVVCTDGTPAADPSDPAAWLQSTLQDLLAQYERLLIGQRTKAALAVKRARGEKTGGDVPFGYRLAADGRTLEPHQAELRAVALVEELRARGMSYRAIAAEMNSRGIGTKRGAKWTPVQVGRVLRRAA